MATETDSIAGIDLEDSYLLGIVVRERQLQLHCLFALTVDHPAYTPPLAGEQHCYREGDLRWNDVVVISSRGQPRAMLSSDANGTLDMGSIEYTQFNGIHDIEADWFAMRFTAGHMEATLSF